MTLEERAKIMTIAVPEEPAYYCSQAEFDKWEEDMEKFFLSHLRAAVEEEQKLRADWGYRIECLEKQVFEYEWKLKMTEEFIKIAYEQRDKFVLEAYEEAAKVLSTLEGDCITDGELMILQSGIAHIRALAAKVEK